MHSMHLAVVERIFLSFLPYLELQYMYIVTVRL